MKSRVILLIIITLVILPVALAIGFVLLLRLFSAVVLVLSLSYLWAQMSVRGITSQVTKSADFCQAGGYFDEEITVFSSSRMPKFLVKVEENTTLPGGHNMSVFNLSSKGAYCWQTKVYCRRRGRYTLGPLTVTVTDPFGFFSLQRNLGETQRVFVYPATFELPFFQPPFHHDPGPGSSRWLISEVGPNAARVREYASGDALNRIHWRSTAHTKRLMVKEFDADRSNYAAKNTWVVLDMYQASQSGDGGESTEEYGVTIAASLIKKYVDSGQQVGLIATGDLAYCFSPETGSEHLLKMLEILALMKATGKVPVERIISQEMERFGVNSVIIVITPAINEQLIAMLRQARKRGAVVMIVLLDSASFGGMARGITVASSLALSGFHFHVVKQGEELAKSLDNRTLIPQVSR